MKYLVHMKEYYLGINIRYVENLTELHNTKSLPEKYAVIERRD